MYDNKDFVCLFCFVGGVFLFFFFLFFSVLISVEPLV